MQCGLEMCGLHLTATAPRFVHPQKPPVPKLVPHKVRFGYVEGEERGKDVAKLMNPPLEVRTTCITYPTPCFQG